MKVIKYHKLIRDNIPEIIKSSNKTCKFSILNDEEYTLELKNKLLEESKELINATYDEVIYELADVLEVLEAIQILYGIDSKELLKIKEEKALKNGKFDKRLLLLETTEND